MRNDPLTSSIEQMERTCWYTIQSLCLMGYRESVQLEQGFRQALENVSLGKRLMRKGVLDREEMLDAIEESSMTGLLVEHILVKNGYCSLPDMMKILAEREEEA
ncbi:MAG: hypothetical protein ACM3YO_05040 [Bacteroidota bacterium]